MMQRLNWQSMVVLLALPALDLCPALEGRPSHLGSCCAACRPSWLLYWNVTPQPSQCSLDGKVRFLC